MNKKRPIIFPGHDRLLARMGEQIKPARKRRKPTTIQVAEPAGLAPPTLSLVEKGNAAEHTLTY